MKRTAASFALLALSVAGCLGEDGPAPTAAPAQPLGAGAARPPLPDAPLDQPRVGYNVEGTYRAKATVFTGVCPVRCLRPSVEVEQPIFPLRVNESATVGMATWVLQAEWTASNALASRLVVSLRDEETGQEAAALVGESPLAAQLPRDRLANGARYAVDVHPDGPGVLLDQAVRVSLRLQ